MFQEQSVSDENGGEASDILSAISNEECSVTSEILDKNSSGNSQFSQSHIHAAEIIQVMFISYIRSHSFEQQKKIFKSKIHDRQEHVCFHNEPCYLTLKIELRVRSTRTY